MTIRSIARIGALPVLVIAFAMAALFVQPAAAQKAKKLKCNGCVNSKQLQNGGVTNADLANNSVNGSKVQDESLTAADLAPNSVGTSEIATDAVGSSEVASESIPSGDLSNEAGLDFAGGNGSDSLTASAAIIETVTLSAPSSGFVIVHASGAFQLLSAITTDSAACSITTSGTAFDFGNQIIVSEATAASVFRVPFGSTRIFSAPAGGGSATYNLVCKLISGRAASVLDTYLTALFVPTRY